jgi:hypothetical protein
MKRGSHWIVPALLCVLGNASCGGLGGLNFNDLFLISISQAPSRMVAGTKANVAAVVSNDPANGGVTWSCAPATSCGTNSFNPDKTPSGVASIFTAPSIPPTGGAVTITATSVSKPDLSFSTSITIGSPTFSFYVAGVAKNDEGHDIYSIAGVVAFASDGSGTVLGGEQDYNDGDRITSPQPQGDKILSGSLGMAANGQGTLTLVTNNSKVGVAGTETFAVAFSNADHALITQFDGTATSNGSLDLQTSTSLPSNGYSFVLSGGGINSEPVVDGGMLFVDASGNFSGTVDVNDAGNVVLGTPIPATAVFSAPDSFGRGTITGGTPIAGLLNYYVVGPEVFRIIDVDGGDTAVGSAYGQGNSASQFANAYIGTSVFSIGNSPDFYAAAGQLTTDATAAAKHAANALVDDAALATNNFTGVGDLNELDGALLAAHPFTGTYPLGANGYGALSFAAGFGSVATIGLYAVDPSLNILDPNNTGSGVGGALIAEMDTNRAGIGVLIPQTDTDVAHFAGDYTFGAQGLTGAPAEFDFLGEATVTEPGGAFAGTGAISDPFGALTGTVGVFSKATFAATAVPDASHAGRFTLDPLALSSTDFASPVNLTVTVYQANAGQLFWISVNPDIESGGSIQQNTLASAPAAMKTKPNNRNN